MPSSTQSAMYPIRTVAQLTGVKPVTLRAWERRYGLVVPARSESGHRLYTKDDISSIHQILEWLEQGVAIGQVKAQLSAISADSGDADGASTGVWPAWQERILAGIHHFDETRVDSVYSEALAVYPVDVVTVNLLLPVLREFGERWQRIQGGIAEEHFFASYLRNKLGARIHHQAHPLNAPSIVVACLPGELHELGAILFALHCSHHGMRPIFMGANLPMTELIPAALRSKADAIVLSGTVSSVSPGIWGELATIIPSLGIPVFIGGRISAIELDQIRRCDAIPLGNEILTGHHKLVEHLGLTSV